MTGVLQKGPQYELIRQKSPAPPFTMWTRFVNKGWLAVRPADPALSSTQAAPKGSTPAGPALWFPGIKFSPGSRGLAHPLAHLTLARTKSEAATPCVSVMTWPDLPSGEQAERERCQDLFALLPTPEKPRQVRPRPAEQARSLGFLLKRGL